MNKIQLTIFSRVMILTYWHVAYVATGVDPGFQCERGSGTQRWVCEAEVLGATYRVFHFYSTKIMPNARFKNLVVHIWSGSVVGATSLQGIGCFILRSAKNGMHLTLGLKRIFDYSANICIRKYSNIIQGIRIFVSNLIYNM